MGKIEDIREFNRFYTQELGVLNEKLLKSSFSLAEARALYEIARGLQVTAASIQKQLNLDPGYLSRILQRFRKSGLITRSRSETDGREFHLSLTPRGRKEFALLDLRSHNEIAAKLNHLTLDQQSELIESLKKVQSLLGRPNQVATPYILRPHRPGDMGWVVERHGALYFQEYGWNERFEALVASITAEFIQNFDPKWERCWIAERNGERIGSIFLVRKNTSTAKLRLLLVEPSARGLGLGKHLVEECLQFARQAGYRKVVLWTNSILDTARHIYERSGFRITEEKKYRDFGVELLSQTWEKKL